MKRVAVTSGGTLEWGQSREITRVEDLLIFHSHIILARVRKQRISNSIRTYIAIHDTTAIGSLLEVVQVDNDPATYNGAQFCPAEDVALSRDGTTILRLAPCAEDGNDQQ